MTADCFILSGISLLTSVIGADTLWRFYYAFRPSLSGKEEHRSSLVRYSAPPVVRLCASLLRITP